MSEKKECCYVCSLRTGILIILLTVVVSSSLHMLAVNFNQNYDNKILIREKRSVDIDIFNKGAKEAAKVFEDLRNKAENAVSSVKEAPANFLNTVQALPGKLINGLGQGIVGVFKNIVGVDEKIGELKTIAQNLWEKCVHYFFLIWSILGITTSTCGIYGIYKNVPKCLTYIVVFFYFSIISGLLIILLMNIDGSIQHKIFISRELCRIEWTSSEYSTTLINIGLSFYIGLLVYFIFVVKEYRNILRKIVAKEADLKDAAPKNDDIPMKDINLPHYLLLDCSLLSKSHIWYK